MIHQIGLKKERGMESIFGLPLSMIAWVPCLGTKKKMGINYLNFLVPTTLHIRRQD